MRHLVFQSLGTSREFHGNQPVLGVAFWTYPAVLQRMREPHWRTLWARNCRRLAGARRIEIKSSPQVIFADTAALAVVPIL